MSIKKMTKDELELLPNKDIAYLIVEDKAKQNTLEIFKQIIKLLELPESTIESKIADFYTALATDKRFVMLEDGTWDLRERHTSDKVIIITDEEEEIEEDHEEEHEEEIDEDHYDNVDHVDNDELDDKDDDLKDLVIIDEDELELEE